MKFGQWLGLIATAAAALLLWNLRAVVIQVFAAVVLAMALCTLVGVVRQRLGCSRPIALLLTLLGLLLLLAVALAAVVPPFLQQFQELLRQLPAAADLAVRLLHRGMDLSSQMLYGKEALNWLRQSWGASSSGGEAVGQSLQGLLGLAGNLGSGLIQLLFVVAVALMIAAIVPTKIVGQPALQKLSAIILAPIPNAKTAMTILG